MNRLGFYLPSCSVLFVCVSEWVSGVGVDAWVEYEA